MPDPVAVSVCFADPCALAAGWDLLAGRLALPTPLPEAGTFVLVDGRVGDVAFLVGGTVVPAADGGRALAIEAEGHALIEALIEPPARAAGARRRAVA